MIRVIKKGITSVSDRMLYSILSEKQKESLKNLFTEEQKEKLKELTQYGRKHKQKKAVKHLRDHLYSLGLTQQTIIELKTWYQKEKNNYVKRMIAWELMQWHANQHTKADAIEALNYSTAAKLGERDKNQLRRISIVQAESLLKINKVGSAQHELYERLKQSVHPDLYLAMANTELTIEERLKWINKAYAYYQLHPITFTSMNEPSYDDLQMKKRSKQLFERGKVSIILPAFNAEDGMDIAVQSILNQTWQNIELLIVDDCSPDETYKVMERFAEQDERIKLFKTPENSGPYVARNIALQSATGEFVTVNDADDWSHEKKIEIQVRHLIENTHIIANTSEHARLTEDLSLYRRGTPGKYIFPNMSSTMFRRQPVIDKLGYWDSVRFAADGEFKRRLLKEFGKESFVDLTSGPLSLPRLAVSSLTSSSAFGYDGFFMGVRKEYVESLEHHHHKAASLYYEYPLTERPFPVPEPMWPQREVKQAGYRQFDVVVYSDFREATMNHVMLNQLLKKYPQAKIGFVQIYHYDLNLSLEIDASIRDLIDGNHIQMLVYGEKIKTNKAIILNDQAIYEEQMYIPEVIVEEVDLVIQNNMIDSDKLALSIESLCNQRAKLVPYDNNIRQQLLDNDALQANFALAKGDWVTDNDA